MLWGRGEIGTRRLRERQARRDGGEMKGGNKRVQTKVEDGGRRVEARWRVNPG